MLAVVTSSYNAAASTVHPVTTWYIISKRSISCPGSANNCKAMTLDQYGREEIFADGATVQFCPGDHQLTSSFRLDNVQNLTLQGSSDSSVRINPGVNITLENCANIIISSLIFNFAGDYSYLLIFTYPVYIIHSTLKCYISWILKYWM